APDGKGEASRRGRVVRRHLVVTVEARREHRRVAVRVVAARRVGERRCSQTEGDHDCEREADPSPAHLPLLLGRCAFSYLRRLVPGFAVRSDNHPVQPELPTGTVTFLFTDIEGSTRLLREIGDAYVEVLAEHHRTLREVWRRHEGVEVGTAGDA